MTYDDFTDGVPNLDDISDDDLEAARRFLETAGVTPLAAKLGLSYGKAKDVVNTLFVYVVDAQHARAARLAGQIDLATVLEAANEARYARLPEGLRW
jgi:AraC-like DNA-binding protein